MGDTYTWTLKYFGKDQNVLRLNSQKQDDETQMPSDNIFETAGEIDGNQLWANGDVVPETQGLWFYTDDNNPDRWFNTDDDNTNSGQWRIHHEGMELNGAECWAHKLVVPNVPANAAVYLRMAATPDADTYVAYQFKGAGNATVVNDGDLIQADDEYVLAVKNNGAKRHLTLTLGGFLLKVLCSTTNGDDHGLYTFAGTDGEVARITVNIAEGFDLDNYQVAVVDGWCTTQQCKGMPLVSMPSEVTGISDVAADGEAADGSYYNLQGQRMGNTPAQRCAYIVNGKKVVVK